MRLLKQYRELHKGDAFMGLSLLAFVPDIAQIVKAHGSETLLDYGCGQGKQYTVERAHEAWGVPMPTLYDPAVAGRDVKPTGQFDGVISTDVLEHIPEDELPAVVDEIAGYARQWAFLSVCCRPANKLLPDGTNAHVTVRPYEWWARFIAQRLRGVTLILAETK